MTIEIPYQNIVENLSTSIIIVDEKLAVKFINSSAEILLEISQYQAEDISLQKFLPGEHSLFKCLHRVLQTSQELIEREMKLYVSTSGEKFVNCSIKLLASMPDSRLLLLEFSELGLEYQLGRDEGLHAQQQVVQGLAHEIKNPLGGLRGAAQLLERQLKSDELKEYTGIIISEADRLHNLLSNMLGPNQETKHTSVNIHVVIQHVRQLVLAEVDERLEFEGDYDPSLPEIYGDFDQLVQIFLNIVRNAVQAMNGIGKITLRTRIKRHITINNQRQRMALAVDIEDNGPGIPESLMKNMFYPLVTGRAEGTGLGLYLSQSLIHRNYGAVNCTSRPGHTVFSVVFPLEKINGE